MTGPVLDPTRLPERSRNHLRTFLAGDAPPPEPRDAAVVVLLRSGPTGLEAFFLHRHATMASAASVAVFPGGGVDRRDAEIPAERWSGPPPEDRAARLGVDSGIARAAVCAAVRETFEETGVLLAGTSPTSLVTSTAGEDWERDRIRLERREVSLSGLLDERDLVLRTDLLAEWSTWVTPVFEPRRYRTFFFVAELPAGQETRDVSTEASNVAWTPVREALRTAHTTAPMLPPQLCTCLELVAHATPADVLRYAATRRVPFVMPEAVVDGDRVSLALPDDLMALAAAFREGGDPAHCSEGA